MNRCKRCGQDKDNTDVLSQTLFHFICKECRQDNLPWQFRKRYQGISYLIEDMEDALISWGNETHFKPSENH